MHAFYELKPQFMQAFISEPFTYPPHFHNSIELLFMEKGAMTLYMDGTPHLIQAKTLAIIPPNCIHSYEIYPAATKHGRLTCIIGGQKAISQSLLCLYDGKLCNPFLQIDDLHPDVPYALQALLQEKRGDANETILRAYYQILLARLLPHLQILPRRDSGLSDMVTPIIQYLNDHFTEPLHLEQIANHFGVSKYTLSRWFSNRLQTNFNAFINSLRIQYAAQLLTESKRKIIDISYECGFQSLQTFNRVFKELTGVCPKDYRMKNSATLQQPIFIRNM